MTPATSGKPRLYFIDNLRWLMIILVVMVHVNVTYSTMGRWYYTEPSRIDLISKIVFGIYGSFTQAFFMGFLFFISGYFVPSAYDRKGFGGFVRGRLFRLGVPALVYMLILHPVTMLIINRFNYIFSHPGREYWNYLTHFYFFEASGPLWFALALLVFSLIYAVGKKILSLFPRRTPAKTAEIPIAHRHMIALIGIIFILAFTIRIFQPIGTAVLNMQLCFFSQYVVLFVAGIMAARQGIMEKILPSFGWVWFNLAVFGGFAFWSAIMLLGGALQGNVGLYNGGLYWQSAAYALWESFFAVAFSLGLWVIFREHFNRQGRFARFLSDNAFGVYVFHAPILVLISLLLRDFSLYPLAKAVFVGTLAVPASFIASYLIRKMPGLKTIFS